MKSTEIRARSYSSGSLEWGGVSGARLLQLLHTAPKEVWSEFHSENRDSILFTPVAPRRGPGMSTSRPLPASLLPRQA